MQPAADAIIVACRYLSWPTAFPLKDGASARDGCTAAPIVVRLHIGKTTGRDCAIVREIPLPRADPSVRTRQLDYIYVIMPRPCPTSLKASSAPACISKETTRTCFVQNCVRWVSAWRKTTEMMFRSFGHPHHWRANTTRPTNMCSCNRR